MQTLTIEETANYLDAAIIINSMDAGHAITHMGINEFGVRFILVTDCREQTVVSEGM